MDKEDVALYLSRCVPGTYVYGETTGDGQYFIGQLVFS
jgi:hypothetical protein